MVMDRGVVAKLVNGINSSHHELKVNRCVLWINVCCIL